METWDDDISKRETSLWKNSIVYSQLGLTESSNFNLAQCTKPSFSKLAPDMFIEIYAQIIQPVDSVYLADEDIRRNDMVRKISQLDYHDSSQTQRITKNGILLESWCLTLTYVVLPMSDLHFFVDLIRMR